INGDILDNNPPPRSKYFTIANDTGWYGNIRDDDGTYRPYRGYQSKAGDIDSVGNRSFFDLDDDITAVSNIGNIPMYFCEDKAYRIEGTYDVRGNGVVVPRQISDTVGCISQNGIIRTDHGLFFPALDGFYYTDGFKVIKISDELNDTYATLVTTELKRKRVQGAYNKREGRYYWTVNANGSTDNDTLFVFDERWGIKRDGCFTT